LGVTEILHSESEDDMFADDDGEMDDDMFADDNGEIDDMDTESYQAPSPLIHLPSTTKAGKPSKRVQTT
jgi:hypothetical protein